MKQPLGIVFLTIVSIALVEANVLMKEEIPVILLFGFFYNMLVNGIIYLLGAFKTFRLPDSHYIIRTFEKQGNLYKRFGVDFARRLIKFSGAVTFDGKRSSLEQLENSMLFVEKCHTVCFALNLITMVYLMLRGLWELIPSLLLFNLLLNVYPIIAQRYNRARVQLVQQRLSMKRWR